MNAIQTTYRGATNFQGAKITARAEGVKSLSMSYPYGADGANAHWQAAQALIERMGWGGTWVSGSLPNGDYVFTNTKSATFIAANSGEAQRRAANPPPVRMKRNPARNPAKRATRAPRLTAAQRAEMMAAVSVPGYDPRRPPPGFRAGPVRRAKPKRYLVQTWAGLGEKSGWVTVNAYATPEAAKKAAKAHHAKSHYAVRVWDTVK